jgi:hypothetical protein
MTVGLAVGVTAGVDDDVDGRGDEDAGGGDEDAAGDTLPPPQAARTPSTAPVSASRGMRDTRMIQDVRSNVAGACPNGPYSAR